MVVLDPVPAYVVKTIDSTKNEKVFINVCTDPQVSAPSILDPSEIALQVTRGEDWMIPIVVSVGRADVDKKGNPSFVVDCCMNPRVVLLGIKDPSVKVLIVETCIESVEDRYHLVLSRDYKFPRMKMKNQLIKTEFDPEQAKELNPDREDEMLVDLPETENIKLGETVASKSHEIEVLESNETDFYLHMYRGPYSGPRSRPSHVVEIEGVHHDIKLIQNLLKLGTSELTLPFKPAYYQGFYDGHTTHVMLWKP